MRYVRGWTACLLVLGILAGLTGCRVENVREQQHTDAGEAATSVVTLYTSFYPLYALTLPLVKGAQDVLLKNLTQPQDGCPRDYALSVWDAAVLSGADMLILGGRGLESFEDATGTGMAVFSAMDELSLIRQGETPVEGDDEASHFDSENPWLWLSVAGAREMSEAIASALMTADPVNAQTIEKNCEAWTRSLDELAQEMQSLCASCAGTRVAVFHEGLAYIASDMGLDVALTVEREPAQEMEADALGEALEQLRAADVQIVLIEKQAPQRTRDDLTQAGYIVVPIDTLMTYAHTDENIYLDVMRENARLILDGCTRAS